MLNNISSEISKILHEEVNKHRASVQKNQYKEVELLNAFKAFMPSENHKAIDEAVNMFYMLNTVQQIQRELNKPAQKAISAASTNPQKRQGDKSVHKDGVYDVDMSCIKRKQSNAESISGMMMIMALMGVL